MRIIAGTLKNSKIATPDGRRTRPSSGRLRGIMFDILAHASWTPPLAGARALDSFAGSGALGLEALSRGAALAYCCDTDAEARRIIAANAQRLKIADRLIISDRDAVRPGRRPARMERFELLFLDPPYGEGLAVPALGAAARCDWLCPGAIAVIESSAGKEAPSDADRFRLMTERICGNSRLDFLRFEP